MLAAFKPFDLPPASRKPQELLRQAPAPHSTRGRRPHPWGRRLGRRPQLPPGPPCKGEQGHLPGGPAGRRSAGFPLNFSQHLPRLPPPPERVQRLPQLRGPAASSLRPVPSGQRGGAAAQDGTGRAVSRGQVSGCGTRGAWAAWGGGLSRALGTGNTVGCEGWSRPDGLR